MLGATILKILLRKIHRWLGLLMALQIIAWMASGLFFALYPITEIRGEHLTHPPAALQDVEFNDLVPVWAAWNNVKIEMGKSAVPDDISLLFQEGKTWYQVKGHVGDQSFARRVNGFTGQVAPRIDAETARYLARQVLAVDGQVEAVELVESAPPGSEIRGRELPAWRVSFSTPESLNLYLDAWTGELLARRTRLWRVYDFLWMLHIMDFHTRDNFHTPLLQGAAGLGLLVAFSGVALWFLTTRLLRRRRASAPGGG